MRTEKVVSAGGVVWQKIGDEVQVLLCGRSADRLWALPKGTPEPGETLDQAALREVREETGVEVEIEEMVGEIRYWFSRTQEGVRYAKTVRHYLMRPVGGSRDLHDHEFDEVRWVPVDQALKMMTYENEARMVRQAAEILRERESNGVR